MEEYVQSMENRIREVRLKKHLIQEIVANEIGVTQQALSKYEHDISIIKVDVLIRIARYFNVTTDYLLGLSEVKRDLQGQMRVNEVLNECYELVEAYKCMDPLDQELLWEIIQSIKKNSIKRMQREGDKC